MSGDPAFQADAFQNDAFQTTAVPPPVLAGWHGVTVLGVPLAVRLVTARSDLHLSRDVRDLVFRSVAPGGFASAELSLDRPLRLDPTEIAAFGDMYVYDSRSGAVLWQGRLEDPGRGAGADGEGWSLRAAGPAAHARARRVLPLFLETLLFRG